MPQRREASGEYQPVELSPALEVEEEDESTSQQHFHTPSTTPPPPTTDDDAMLPNSRIATTTTPGMTWREMVALGLVLMTFMSALMLSVVGVGRKQDATGGGGLNASGDG